MIDREGFLARWSRLKQEWADERAAQQSVPDTPPAIQDEGNVPADLPPVESLDFSSDFTAFLRNKVEESVKRAALKKLFHSPEFNQMDGLDVYVDDYSRFEPIPQEMLEKLTHARDMLFGSAREEPKEPAAPGAGSERAAKPEPEATLPPVDPPQAECGMADKTDVPGQG